MEKLTFDLPIRTFGGSAGGLSAVITGGVHGDEQTGIHTAMLVCERLAQANVLGRVTVLPFSNPEASRVRRRQAPQDGLDLNRTFPGRPDGSYSEQLAWHIWQLTDGYDYLLDLHCCSLYGSTYGMGFYSRHPWAEELLSALMLDTVVHTKGTRGQLYIEAAERRGQKGVLIELPGGQPGGVIDVPAAEKCADGVMNYLVHIGAVQGQEKAWDKTAFCSTLIDCGTAECDGLFKPAVPAGSAVDKGAVLGWIDGKPMTAPCDAVATMVSPMRYAFKGMNLFNLTERRKVQPGEIPCPEAK